ncbi:hypothetical protein OCH239_03575 [Roseivivax halodurans JCM 10272]|uniref:PAS domain-containing protein n=1 Tax=Roseivivax halodurans JCM 10272 TaxID=1449350 RepID=X7EH23_9RHOB|nr:PAS domain-containing protein [Roseivivax halodurans]ETX14383.1 hypothetical protein OCH239_03575 [Roseivivax halodurans JCM 10272]
MSDSDTFRSRVISMSDHDRARAMRPLHQIETYWQALAEDCGGVPSRDRVDPRGIQDALEYAFLAQRIAPGMARVRVAGSHLADLMGMEIAGLPLTSFLMPDSRDALTARAEEVWAEGAVLHAELAASEGLGRGPLTGRLLLLPLTSEPGRIDRALGGFVTTGRIGRTPRRFEITAIEASPLRLPAPRPKEPLASVPTGFAEQGTAFIPRKPTTSPSRAHLRLVVSND